MAEKLPGNGVIRFGAFEVDVRAGEVRKHGIRIRLQDQPFRLLQILLEHPGEVVSRDELQGRIWPADTFVDFERGLNNAVKRLREALSDSAESPRYVETLPKRGYRFIGTVENGNGHVHVARAGAASTALPSRARPARVFAFVSISAVVVLSAGVLADRNSRATRNGHPLVPNLKLVKVIDSLPENSAKYVALSGNGRLIAYTDDLGIHVKEVESGELKSFPTPAEAQLPSQGEADARLPIAWFPDGARLLVNTKRDATMWSISLLTGKAQKLGQDGWASAVAPDGSLIAFVRKESEVWVMGSHGEHPRPVILAEPGITYGRIMWSPDSQRIAYVKIQRGTEVVECSIETRRLDAGPSTPILSDPQLCQEQPVGVWTADDRIVFSLKEVGGEGSNLWWAGIDRRTGTLASSPVRLTNWPQTFVNGVSGSADGKRLVFRRTNFRNVTYLLDLTSAGFANARPMRLLLAEKESAWPTAWTSDSRSVVFYRMNGGNTDIFRQDIDKRIAEPILKTAGEQLSAVLTPDGQSFIYMYIPSYERFGTNTAVRLMRVPAAGGPSQLVLMSKGYNGHRCPRLSGSTCVLGELSPSRRQLIFYSFDPQHGSDSAGIQDNKKKLFSIDIERGEEPEWDISPDGSLLAISGQDEHEIPIHFMSLKSRPSFDVTIKGWGNGDSMFWSADGRSLYISCGSATEETLLQVDLQGHALPLYKQKGAFGLWGVPSPNGRYLALLTMEKDSDVWLAENF